MEQPHAASTRRSLMIAADLLAGGVTSAARGQAGRTTVKVGFTGINEYTGLFLATDLGLFAKRGLDVTPTLLPNNSLIPSALVSAAIDIGTPGINILLVAVDGGLPLKLICGAGLLSASRPTVGLVARTGSNIQNATDLAGKRVAVPGFNAGFHVTAREWIQRGGQDLRAVNFVEASFAQMPDLLRGGQADVVVAGEPIRGRIIDGGLGYALGNMLSAIRDPAISGTYATTEGYAARNPAVIRAFRESIEEAHALAIATPGGTTLESVSRHLRLPLEVLQQVPSANLESRIDVEGLAYWIELMVRQGLMRRPVDARALLLA